MAKVYCICCEYKLSKRERKFIEAAKRAITGRPTLNMCTDCVRGINKVASKMKRS